MSLLAPAPRDHRNAPVRLREDLAGFGWKGLLWRTAALPPTCFVGLWFGVTAVTWGKGLCRRMILDVPEPIVYCFGIVGSAVGVLVTLVPIQHVVMLGFRRNVVERALRRETCPGCGYGLAALPLEADCCRVCPECGAAWRLEP
ncbi:MAG: hypothetical protein WD749_10755 [Phycisphaerales bacterium]